MSNSLNLEQSEIYCSIGSNRIWSFWAVRRRDILYLKTGCFSLGICPRGDSSKDNYFLMMYTTEGTFTL